MGDETGFWSSLGGHCRDDFTFDWTREKDDDATHNGWKIKTKIGLTFDRILFHIFFHALGLATSSTLFLRVGHFFSFLLIDGTLIFNDVIILHCHVIVLFILLILQLVSFVFLLQNGELFFGLLLSGSVFGQSVVQLVDFIYMLENIFFISGSFILLGSFIVILL
jgi:hypothetical protein